MTTIILHFYIASLGMNKFICSPTQPRATDLRHLERILDTSLTFQWFLLASDIFDEDEIISDQFCLNNIDFLHLVLSPTKFSAFLKYTAVESETKYFISLIWLKCLWSIFVD
jgi:hypothetical protein